ncbi:MAG: hypothetical protein HS114_28845 [Anaerolineales bacterium]|nr:hypothetical protein [Anaerolineales bacterium]
MDELTLTPDGLQVCQDEYLMSQVLNLLFHGKDANGRAHSIESACREVGIGTTTWYRWVKDGALEPHKAALAAQMSSAIQEIVIPRYRDIYQGLVSLALGQRPANADPSMEVKAGDMIKAIKLLSTVVPVQALAAPDQNESKEAEDYLEGAQFKQIFVKGDMNFIYQGNGQPQFGQLEGGDIVDAE